jgi:predicted HD phosphohydrolase
MQITLGKGSPFSKMGGEDALQGGVMDAAEVQHFKRWGWWCEAVWLRRLDDAAKIPDLRVPGLEHYRTLLQALSRKGERV